MRKMILTTLSILIALSLTAIVFAQDKGAKGGGGKGKGFTLLIDGKRYAAFPPKAKTAAQPEQSEQAVDVGGAS